MRKGTEWLEILHGKLPPNLTSPKTHPFTVWNVHRRAKEAKGIPPIQNVARVNHPFE